MSELIFNKSYHIRSYEGDFENVARINAITNMMQDIASMHAAKLGFGYDDFIASQRAWVLSRAYIRMNELPVVGDEIRVETWPAHIVGPLALRGFKVFRDERQIGSAVSAWAVIDINERCAVPAEEMLKERELVTDADMLEFEGRAVKRLKEGEHETRFFARKSDQDVNRHVNSMRQAEFCFDGCPDDWYASKKCVGADIQFRAECHAGDEIRSLFTAADDNTAQHGLFRVGDGKEIARMKSWWI